jgi:mRNA interferase RelE/StbE
LDWKIEYLDAAQRNLDRLDRQAAKRIVDYMDNRIATAGDPRLYGKALTGNLSGLWRYRVGDYRVVCRIHDDTICVLVLDVGHRGDIYRKH